MPIHTFRHTHTILLLESGASMKYVQERLGHKSIRVTADIYSHISKKIDLDSMNKYEEYISKIMEWFFITFLWVNGGWCLLHFKI